MARIWQNQIIELPNRKILQPEKSLAVFSIVVASTVLVIGWGLGVDALIHVLPAYPAMMPTTAICLVLAGLAVLSLSNGHGRTRAVTLAMAIPFVLVMDPWFLSDDSTQPIREGVSLSCAFGLLTLPLSVVLRSGLIGTHRTFPMLVDTAAAALAGTALISFLFSAPHLHAVPGYTQIAIHTALLLLLLHLALLMTDPTCGWIDPLFGSSEDVCTTTKKTLLASAFIVVSVLMITQKTLETGWLSANFQLSILAALIVAGLVFHAVKVTHHKRRSEKTRQIVEPKKSTSMDAIDRSELPVSKSENMRILGQIVAGVAHDLNNSLSVMRGNLELIKMDPTGGSDYLDEAISAVDRAASLTTQILDYGRKSNLERKIHPVNELIKSPVRMFRRVAPANVSLEMNLNDTEGSRIFVDASGIERAILNLLINARDAMDNGGSIHINVEERSLSPESTRPFNNGEGMVRGKYVIIGIQDTGKGMTEDVLAKATVPFFTTKEDGKGNGIGLSSVQGFCKQNGGGMMIQSTPGEGTTILLAFPCGKQEVEREPQYLQARSSPASLQPHSAPDRHCDGTSKNARSGRILLLES